MWPDRVSNPGPLALESDTLHLRYAAQGVSVVNLFMLLNMLKPLIRWTYDLET